MKTSFRVHGSQLTFILFLILFLPSKCLIFSRKDLIHQQTIIRSCVRGCNIISASTEKKEPSECNSILKLSKSIIGTGMFSLPGSVSVSFSKHPHAIAYSLSSLLVTGIASTYGFYSIGSTLNLHNSTSLSEAWNKSTGTSTGKIISLLVVFKLFLTSLCHLMIIGDLLAPLKDRSTAIILSGLALAVLTGQSSPGASKLNAIGIMATLISTLFIVFRSFDGSYAIGGAYDIQPPPTETTTMNFPTAWKLFPLVSVSSSAFSAHHSAPRIWLDLQHHSSPLSAYRRVVSLSFFAAAILSASVLVCGFSTFRVLSKDFVLNNYSLRDPLAKLVRLAVSGAILSSLPLTLASLTDELGRLVIPSHTQSGHHSKSQYKSLMILFLLLLTAIRVTDLGMLVTCSSALVGSCLMFIIPMSMNMLNFGSRFGGSCRSSRCAVFLADFTVLCFGIALCVLGIWKTTTC